MIVTIDGPAGSGKSTAARGLALRLGFQFLDTGAMYRAIALLCIQKNVDLEDEAKVDEVTRSASLTFQQNRIHANGVDIGDDIRAADVTQAASLVAMHPMVRKELVRQQQSIAAGQDIVCEGRDQGTVVFPQAECKFFLTADPQERAIRRKREARGNDQNLSTEEIQSQIEDRDYRDVHRDIAPLKSAADAFSIDTSNLSPVEVLDLLEKTVQGRRSVSDSGE